MADGMDRLRFVGEVAFVFDRFFTRFDPHCSVEVVQLSCSLTAFVASHDIYGVHPPIFIKKFSHTTLLQMKFVRIVMSMMSGGYLFLSQSYLGQSLACILTSVLEFWSVLVPIKVTIGVDDSVLLLELIRTFFANSICLVRKRSDTHISGTSGSSAHEFEHPRPTHSERLIKLNTRL